MVRPGVAWRPCCHTQHGGSGPGVVRWGGNGQGNGMVVVDCSAGDQVPHGLYTSTKLHCRRHCQRWVVCAGQHVRCAGRQGTATASPLQGPPTASSPPHRLPGLACSNINGSSHPPIIVSSQMRSLVCSQAEDPPNLGAVAATVCAAAQSLTRPHPNPRLRSNPVAAPMMHLPRVRLHALMV